MVTPLTTLSVSQPLTTIAELTQLCKANTLTNTLLSCLYSSGTLVAIQSLPFIPFRYVADCELTHAAAVAEQQQTLWQQQKALTLLCPVCREPITLEETSNALQSYPPPAEEDTSPPWCSDAPEVKALREKMAALYLKQKSNGGIIDLEQEKNKFLVNLTQVGGVIFLKQTASFS